MPDSADDRDSGTPDLRFSKDARHGVHIERNLSADGHLARGDGTRMSRLNMSVRALPRDAGERDPVFEGRASEPVDAPSSAAPVAAVEPATEPTFMERVARLFGKSGS